jgi:hypothetical protein
MPSTCRAIENGDRSLERIGQQCGRGEFLVAGAQHIGGADVARSDLADIPKPGHAGQDQTERYRAAKIAEKQRTEHHGSGQRPLDHIRHGAFFLPWKPVAELSGRTQAR